MPNSSATTNISIEYIRDLRFFPSFCVTSKKGVNKKFNPEKFIELTEKHADKKGPKDLSSKHDKYLYQK